MALGVAAHALALFPHEFAETLAAVGVSLAEDEARRWMASYFESGRSSKQPLSKAKRAIVDRELDPRRLETAVSYLVHQPAHARYDLQSPDVHFEARQSCTVWVDTHELHAESIGAFWQNALQTVWHALVDWQTQA
jgi:hypothetical protein